jgi:hypothetical protein
VSHSHLGGGEIETALAEAIIKQFKAVAAVYREEGKE